LSVLYAVLIYDSEADVGALNKDTARRAHRAPWTCPRHTGGRETTGSCRAL